VFTLTDYWKILNYLGGTSVIDLDINTQILASSEQSVSLNLFENTIDQIPHMTDDYKRLKNFLVDWYAAHRTMVTTQKQAHDVFSLPDRDLSELLQSFGFIFSTTSMSFLTKANFFLDLVNLYKVKGTPQTLIDVLQYFGLSDIDIAEYWLEKNNSGDLVFKSERYLPAGVLDITFSDISFADMIRNDPHWRLSASQIENLLTVNKIGLPSKSPYFSIRPRYNLSVIKTLISILSRHVQDTYTTYISGGTLTKDIKLTQLNIYASFFDLYLACVYSFNENYNRTTGSTDQQFFCYDGTSIPDISVAIDQYSDLTSRIGSPSSTQNESRSARESKILRFYDLFTRNISTNFLTSYTTAGTILKSTNLSLYNTINTYISSGNGDELISYLMNDLNAWIISNIGTGYPNIATTVLGLGSLLELNNIINFFKPYHARMIKLEFALIVQDPLLDSLVMEDVCYDNITEVVVDFDVADGTACDNTSCIECIEYSDATCISHYSREKYDCGSQFDIGASIDDPPTLLVEQTIEDIMNFHDATSSNAYEQLLFVDSTNFSSTETFCDGSSTLSILLAGGWADFDENGTFDGQNGNDLVQIYIQDLCLPNTWATTTALNGIKGRLAGCGNTSDSLCFGGYSDDQINTTEIWNSFTWTTTTSLTEAKDNLAGCGSTLDSLCFGGYTDAVVNTTEKWNGSLWATTTSLTESKRRLAGCGNTSDSLCFGGYTDADIDTTEIWNGSVWATTTSLTESKDDLAGCGITLGALSIGGNIASGVDTTEIWDGSLWATTTVLAETVYSNAGCGNVSNALCFGGYNGGHLDTTEVWNGLVWVTASSLIEGRNENAGCGNISDALCFGGYTGNRINTTEIWS